MTPAEVVPQNPEAEESVLGAIMLAGASGVEESGAVLGRVRGSGLTAADFYRASYGLIYAAAVAAVEGGGPADVLAVERELRARGQLSDAGGRIRLHELAALVPATANAGHYAGLVVDAAERREESRAGLALARAAENGGLAANPEVREQVTRLVGPRRGTRSALYTVDELAEFAAVEEPGAEPLVRARGGVALPADGLGLVYGDGGAGKTTLCIDWAIHFAAGETWLDLLEPTRPLRVLLLENEGPRAEYRRKLRDRLAAWKGGALEDRIKVLREPWAQVSLGDERHRQALAQEIGEHTLDLVIPGPLASLGMLGAGNADDVQAFLALLADVRARTEQRFGFLIVHHENRAGKVSGAWEPHPDLLAHVQAQGHGSLRVHWQKARWASGLHKTTAQLRWAEGATFVLDERAEASRPERVWDELAAFVLANGGCAWNTVEKSVKGGGPYLRERRDWMLADGVLINAGEGQAFELWHRDDPARPHSIEEPCPAADTVADTVASPPGDAGSDRTVSAVSPRRGDTVEDTVGSRSPADTDGS